MGLWQGCVMSQWVFNLFMDWVVWEVNLRVFERGAVMLSVSGGGLGDESVFVC